VQVALPDNLVLVGEAVASFNPVYGQGMTVSILEAMELDKILMKCRHLEDMAGLSQVAFGCRLPVPSSICAMDYLLKLSIRGNVSMHEGFSQEDTRHHQRRLESVNY
jgi:hypothetical protein